MSFTLPAVAVVLPAALLALAGLLLRDGSREGDARLLGWRVAAVGYAALLITATFFPFRIDLQQAGAPWWWLVNWRPVVTIDLRTFSLNIAMTVPLGVLLPVLTRARGLGGVAAAGLAVSLGVESAQLAFGVLLGTGRAPDVNDLIANTLGAAVGFLLLRALAPALARSRMLPRRASRRPATAG